MEQLLESGKYSDFTIICGAKEWKVHRAIICPQSEYFTILCDSNFKESKDAELDLSAEPPLDVENMLKFLYTGSYTFLQAEAKQPNIDLDSVTAGLQASSLATNEDGDENEENQADTGPEPPITQVEVPSSPEILRLQHHIVMYAIGDRYIIEKLKTQAAKYFIDGLPNKWTYDNWCLMESVDEKTAPTDQTLRTPIMELWLNDGIKLFESQEFRDKVAQFPTMELEFLRKHATNMSCEISALNTKLALQASDMNAQSLLIRNLSSKRNSVKGSIEVTFSGAIWNNKEQPMNIKLHI
ncbi:uncharacterized protein DFL_004441 [Arthrobotrys flagrans]|uniref:BTB domain-containing protein n=1 Tax=Arthrobotrys flagrans TaxID=97331 RepID=A0A437A4N1_ARTFL|nr:hypothetical protein DFL_004441 [Arthrobotrys flagrans]